MSRELTMLSLPCLVVAMLSCLDLDTCVRRTEDKGVAVTQCEACRSHRDLGCSQCLQRSQGRPLAQLGRFRAVLISLMQGGGGICPSTSRCPERPSPKAEDHFLGSPHRKEW